MANLALAPFPGRQARPRLEGAGEIGRVAIAKRLTNAADFQVRVGQHLTAVPAPSGFQQLLITVALFLQAPPQGAGRQVQAIGQSLRRWVPVSAQYQSGTSTAQGVIGVIHQRTFPFTLGQRQSKGLRVGGG